MKRWIISVCSPRVSRALKLVLFVVLLCVPLNVQQVEATEREEALPMRVRMVLSQAGRLMQLQQYAEAEQLLEGFHPREGGSADATLHPRICFALGNCRLQQQRYAEAVAAYRQALEGAPDYAPAWLNLARACYRQEDYPAAATAFLEAYTNAEDGQSETLYYAAVAALLGGDPSGAVGLFERLRTAQELWPLAWKESYARALLAADKGLEALPLLEALAAGTTGAVQTQWRALLLSQCLQYAEYDRALALVNPLLAEDCGNSRWWKALAHIQLERKNLEGALTALTLYGYLTPPSWAERRLIADLNLQLNLPRQALPRYQQLLAEKADDHVLANLVYACRKLGRDELALEQLERFGAASDSSELLLLKADLLYALERFDESAQVYRQVARMDDEQAGKAWLMAGYAAQQEKDSAASRSD
jgi:tetratricopeptide (TPR) repeat protein